ncbi:hypothetical protein RIF29_34725 [Crotalaria pallida]|uniref:inorganic diphosphatase n=1 Tax=Crotalaria pallida TaxID=3830 RepID=A0AAN9E960_CROPI
MSYGLSSLEILFVIVNLCGNFRTHWCNIHWNNGLIPQTWEDPSISNSEVEGAFGDNDPVDVVEIGERQRKIGEVGYEKVQQGKKK